MAWIHECPGYTNVLDIMYGCPVHIVLYCTTYTLFEAFVWETFTFLCHLAGFWCINVTHPGG